MNDENIISCLLCVYKNDKFQNFINAYNSIISQLNVKYEIIIVVDGPIIEEIKLFLKSIQNYPNVKIIWLSTNQGHGIARSIGVNSSQTKYIAIFDADDISSNDRLIKSYNYLEQNKEFAIVSGLILEVWSDGLKTYRDCSKINFKYSSPVNQNSCMFRKDSYLEVGGYISWYHNEDTFLWTRMIEKNWKIGFISDILVTVNFDNNSLKRRRGLKYFISECKLRYYMYNKNLINEFDLLKNIYIRFITQLILPFKIFKLIYIWNRRKL